MPTLDVLVLDLRRLRVVRGGASYAELATRIQALREARGLSPAAARVARSALQGGSGLLRLPGDREVETTAAG